MDAEWHSSEVGSISASQLQGPGFYNLISEYHLSIFHLFSLHCHGSLLGSPGIQKHAHRQTRYAKFPLSVNDCESVYVLAWCNAMDLQPRIR